MRTFSFKFLKPCHLVVENRPVPEMTEQQMSDLVVAHLPLVGYHVNEVLMRVPSSVSRDDLASAGSLALVLASRAYDPSTGVPFGRYAALRIRGALLDELRSMDWASRGARQRARELSATSDRLTSSLGRAPSREELAAAIGTDVAGVDAARHDSERRVLSIDASVNPLADVLSDGAPGPEELLLTNERLTYLKAAVQTLPERLRYVVEQLFFHDRPVIELADELDVTQSRVSQLRSEALALLRDGMNASLDPELVAAAERPDGVAERRRQAYFASVAARAAESAKVSGILATPAPQGVVPLPHEESSAIVDLTAVAG
ncbi:sigma-70 family RNA polymerase sigma factor [Cellulomonas sp. P24]|uniref:sigma-70 family RNA polymerase sigma factor n=1 Tax=Cellulomonas sp. P24 TaxID=2885206 RepID=UPI00216B00C0|nr:sigma-70 family RNA polymerase sigma factor [Cellulomonas sp. P24]MCR6493441.1 sigma-70 family RNA polymerase sigma factor [Cellulomonas sp. P24]